jgi:cardiolipin synthase
MTDLLLVTVPVPALLLVLGALAFVALALVLYSTKRHSDPRPPEVVEGSLDLLLPSIAGMTHDRVIGGNAVEVLENGRFFDALFEEIDKAGKSIHFETFLWKEGRLGTRLAEALARRARDGLVVRVLVDGNGAREMGEAAERTMRDAGCRFLRFNRHTLRDLGRINRRDHRKLCVCDGRVALVGGHCIVDGWLGDARNRDQVRDVGVRLRGPAVASVQSTFGENWVDGTGELFVGEAVFPLLDPVGDVAIHAASLKPEGAPPAVKVLHLLMLRLARERLWIQNPYFLPDPQAITALCDAVRRGVDVRVMVPSVEASDFPVVQHAAHHNFEALLAGGVRILEFSRCLLHQKVMAIDGTWSAVGSSNFDDRSFEINDELTLGIHDRAVAARLESIFEADTADCIELDLAGWRRRPAWMRWRDRLYYLFNEQL